jgi:hypothetical protein
MSLSVLGKINSIFQYDIDESGKPTGKTINALTEKLSLTQRPNMTVTGKVDGTCCLVRDGQLYPRYDKNVRRANKPDPVGWIPTNGVEPDAGGHVIGFRPINGPQDKWHQESLVERDGVVFMKVVEVAHQTPNEISFAIREVPISVLEGKTVELVGPKINGNKHGVPVHSCVVHGSIHVECNWSSHESLSDWYRSDIGSLFEGVVLHDINNNELFKTHRGHVGQHTLSWKKWGFV